MWKKLLAAVAGLSLVTSEVGAQAPASADPAFPKSWSFAPPIAPPAPPKPVEKPKPVVRKPDPDGFSSGIFTAPFQSHPQPTVIQAGAQLGEPRTAPIPNPMPDSDPIPGMQTDEFMWGPSTAPRSGHSGPWVWGSADLLLGNTSGVNVPPVVTTGPAAAGLAAGAIGAPGTVVLFGNKRMLDNWRTGLRLEAGAWLGEGHFWGVSGRFYSMYSTSDQLVGAGNGTNVVNLPQLVTIGGVTTQIPVFVGFPGVTVGTVATTAQTSFAGGDLNLRRLLVSNEDFRFELFAGFRQMHLGDQLGAAFRSSGGLGAVILLAGDDDLRTRNNFYGGQVGSLGSIAFGRWTLQGQSAFAIGVNVSDLDFSRSRLATIGTAVLPLVQTESGGQVNYFSVAAEGGLRLGFRISEHAKLTVGYTGIYWSNVRRAQEQYNLSATPTGGTTHFYTNMMSLGAELRY